MIETSMYSANWSPTICLWILLSCSDQLLFMLCRRSSCWGCLFVVALSLSSSTRGVAMTTRLLFTFSLPFFQGRIAFHRVCLDLHSCPALLQLHFASCCRVVSCLLAAIFSCRISPHLPLPLLDHRRPCLTNHHLIAGAARPAGASDVQHFAAIVRRAIRDPRSRFNCQELRIMMIMIHLAISSYCLSQCCGL